ncbi:MAG: RDD family protein [Bacteroidota bacterium]
MNAYVIYAGFWKRFVSYILDQLIIGFARIVIFVPIWLFVLMGYFAEHNYNFEEDYTNVSLNYFNNEFSAAMISLLIFVVIVFCLINVIADWLYYALMESSKKQATLGKMIMAIKVTDLSGNKVTFGRATGRYFGKILSGMLLGIGYIMAGFTKKKQALHDILSNCLVVNSISFTMSESEIQQ